MTLLPVLAGPAVLVALGYGVTVVAPATARTTTTRAADTRTYTKAAERGRHLYATNGCVYCHTLARRDAYTDAGLGKDPSTPAESLNDAPALMGEARYGPDLSCAGDRVPTAAKDAAKDTRIDLMVAYLTDPAAFHHGTTMPSYRILRTADLRRLATYLVEHTCGATP
jgi:cbb3-type cytochrome oxidase cytochrome c subunit